MIKLNKNSENSLTISTSEQFTVADENIILNLWSATENMNKTIIPDLEVVNTRFHNYSILSSLLQDVNETYTDYGIYKSNAIISESILASNNPQYITSDISGKIIYTGLDTILSLSTNYGYAFNDVHRFDDNISALQVSANSKYLVVATKDKNIYVSTNNGASFTSIDYSPKEFVINDIAISEDGKQIAIITEGGFIDSYDYGNTWFTNFNHQSYQKIVMDKDGRYRYVIDSVNKLLFSDNGGIDYAELAGYSDIYQVACSDDGSILYAYDAGNAQMIKSTDYGYHYNAVIGIDDSSINSIAISNDAKYVILTSETGVYYSTDYLETFDLDESITKAYLSVINTHATLKLLILDNNTIIRTTYNYQYDTDNAIILTNYPLIDSGKVRYTTPAIDESIYYITEDTTIIYNPNN